MTEKNYFNNIYYLRIRRNIWYDYLTVTEVRLIAVFTASVIQLEIIIFVAPCQFFLVSPSPPSSTQP